MADYPFIRTPQAVEELAGLLAREKIIAVDTEADSFFHYFEKLCLLQISASRGTWLIDPLALGEGGLDPLAPVFSDPSIRKVLHAAEYDLYVLHRHAGLKVRNIFDTMISAQLLGYAGVGLGALVERHLGIRLSKDQQRTDWSRRPLRPAQIEYAAADVLYLIEVSGRVERELSAKGRLEWAREEFALLEARVWPERDSAELGYLKIKGAKQLASQTLAVLRELYLMRDRRARAIDRPPFKVLGNGTLLELATNPAQSRQTLAKRKGITELVMRRMGQQILEATAAGLEGPEHPPIEKIPDGSGRRHLDRRGDARLDQLKRWRKLRSEQLELDPGVFCPNAVLEEIAAADPGSVEEMSGLGMVKGWWAREFGAECLEAGARANRTAPKHGEGPGAGPVRKRSRRGGRGRSRQPA
ncbi:MAG: ribonuclease D [Proteobacteria bacterium]|nr:ribonuclease D [Pseudomonadota bacterium]